MGRISGEIKRIFKRYKRVNKPADNNLYARDKQIDKQANNNSHANNKSNNGKVGFRNPQSFKRINLDKTET